MTGFAVIRDDTPTAAIPKGAVVAMGNFDGVHLGHRAVIDAIENREGARAEAVMREHARLAVRNLRLALRSRTHLDLLPALTLVTQAADK